MIPLWLALLPAATAWQSHCYVNDEERLCDDGYEKARHGWLTSLDHPNYEQPEHAQLFLDALVQSGVPQSINNPMTLTHGVHAELISAIPFYLSIDPVAEAPQYTHERVVTPMEMSQLPDHSYALWDWARGNEICPPGEDVDPQLCHAFAGHMGALNSSHFLPQAQSFYAHYHALAVGRAQECADLYRVVPHDDPRLVRPALACEQQAMLLEAIGQHYLQDAWSAGHMWERWGGPEIDDFPDLFSAFVIAGYSGTWHGAKAVFQTLPVAGWVEWDDPLCAPAPTGERVLFIDPLDGAPHDALGDIFRAELHDDDTYQHQRDALMGCSMAGIREVYAATGQAHAPMRAADHPALMDGRDPTGETCFGQRVTNLSLDLGAQIHQGAHPNQRSLVGRYYDVLLTSVLGMQAPADFDADLPTAWAVRRDLSRARAALMVRAWFDPFGTDAASGDLPPVNWVSPNGGYQRGDVGDVSRPPAPWLDPALPWTLDGSDQARALVLTFSEAHAADLCAQSADALAGLPAWAYDSPAETDAEHDARVDLCEARTRPLLRVGFEGDHQADQEPVCAYTDPGAAFVYSQHEEPTPHDDALHDWCVQRPSLVRNSGFERSGDDWAFTHDAERTTEHTILTPADGDFMLRLRADPAAGATYAVATQTLIGTPGTSGGDLPAGTYTLRFMRRTVTHEDNHWLDPDVCERNTNPWFVARIDSADATVANTIVHESDPRDWCRSMVRFDGAHYYEPDWVAVEETVTFAEPVPLPSLTFQVGTSVPKRHIVLVDAVSLEPVEAER